MVIETLQKGRNPVAVLDFTPWEISGHASLSQAFFRELENTVARDAPNDNVTNNRVQKLRAYAKLAALGGETVKLVGKALRAFGEETGLAIETAAEAFKRTGEIASEAAEAGEAKVKAAEHSLSELKRSVTKEMKSLKRPILIVIDDIDRLTSEEIREIFQLVKANANFPNLIYMLMFDREIVSVALDVLSGGRGSEFLDKIVQVLLHVPQPVAKDVHQLLFDALDLQLGAPGLKERWDTTRWSQVWLGGMANYFRNLRNVYRYLGSFGFQVTQMKNGDTFELNPVDLIALEALRLFEPALYENLLRHKRLLVEGGLQQLFTRDEDARKAREAEVQKLVQLVPEGRRSRVIEILRCLFPAAFGHNHPGPESLIRELRVGHPLIFDRYFTLSFVTEDVSQAEVDLLRNNLVDPVTFAAACESLAASGKLEAAFERLDAYKTVLAPGIFPMAITSLCDVGDSLPCRARDGVFELKFDTLVFAWRLIHFGIKQITDEDARFQLLRLGIAESSGVRLSVQIASHEERVGDRHEFLVTEAHAEELKVLAQERVRAAANDGRLRNLPDLFVILVHWRNWSGEKEVREWIASAVDRSSDALWLLRTILKAMTIQGTRVRVIRYIDLRDLEMFIEIAAIEKLTSELELDALSQDEHRALRAFRQALIWKSEGKPEGHFGYDDGSNPLAEDS